ncbi:MAG: dioxygenase [Magnetococcales bacterium]|nr:dioxygenase [Magnetococcales bacterium]
MANSVEIETIHGARVIAHGLSREHHSLSYDAARTKSFVPLRGIPTFIIVSNSRNHEILNILRGVSPVASRIRLTELLNRAGIPANLHPTRGFDQGMFIPLKVSFPEADVPVVQLSLLASLDPQAHLEAGRALAPLRDEGVAIVGSGMSFHNMRGYGNPKFGPISDTFDHWLTTAVEADQEMRDPQFFPVVQPGHIG